MKISVKCLEFLTNKGNGKKCKLAPLCRGKHLDCPFILNGIKESSTKDEKIKYIYSLAARCFEWHQRKKETNHYYKEIEPQIDTICENIKEVVNKQNKLKLAKK